LRPVAAGLLRFFVLNFMNGAYLAAFLFFVIAFYPLNILVSYKDYQTYYITIINGFMSCAYAKKRACKKLSNLPPVNNRVYT